MALTLVLLVGAGLLARSFARLLAVDPGFRADNAVVMDVDVPLSPATGLTFTHGQSEQAVELQRMVQFYDELTTRFTVTPRPKSIALEAHSWMPPSITGRASRPAACSTLAAIAARGPLSQIVTIGRSSQSPFSAAWRA